MRCGTTPTWGRFCKRGEILIVAQVLIAESAAIPLAVFAREIGVSPKVANLLAIAYLLSPSAQEFTYDNLSENVFVPVLAFSAALFARRRTLWSTLLCAELLMAAKEGEGSKARCGGFRFTGTQRRPVLGCGVLYRRALERAGLCLCSRI